MNRALIFAIAIFFAVVGIALLGGDSNKVLAGHGCHCSCGGCGGCDGGCGGCGGCHCGGLFARLRARRCCGCCAPSCCAPANCAPACCAPAPTCGGGAMEPAPAAPAAPAPPAPASTKVNAPSS